MILSNKILMTLEHLLHSPVYTLNNKQGALFEMLHSLISHHRRHCLAYDNMLSAIGYEDATTLETLPYLPVRLFKMLELRSVPENEVIRTMVSSGTTSQQLSKIFLDAQTAAYQTKALVKILQNFLGKARLPMLIIDSQSTLKNPQRSARAAGILGLSNFGRDHTYVLDDAMHLQNDVLDAFLQKYHHTPILIFGFTFMVWEYFLQPLKARGIDLSNATLLHSGGWKKLQDQAVDNATFKALLQQHTGIKKVHNFYGMVEQVGSIFMECEAGHLHTPSFAEVMVRDPLTLAPLDDGKEGLLEVLSVLPQSYPGHILLTEDLGTIQGRNDCSCGRAGTYFSVSGRLAKAELRGCSDTHEPI